VNAATAFGRPHRHLRSTDSTNERARKLAAAAAPSGTVVTAAHQSAGRGRTGRRWSAPPGSALLYSAILRPLDARHRLLPLAVPLAVCEAVEESGGVECRVKWPNDVWLSGRKVAGVLIEARPPDWAVIGVGVNVAIPEAEFPDDLRWPATSIGAGATVDGTRRALNGALGRWVEAPTGEVLEEFRRRDALTGREIGWEGTGARDGSGLAAGIDDDGNLLVRTPDGQLLALGAGEVSLRLRPGDASGDTEG
jgi:BirA family transcriptional regulator, biotin operon repressor / biotin---[acetyl-CoA-carboxylase] ligase